MLVLVTGGLGFIGTPLCDRLEHEGHEVRILDVPYNLLVRETAWLHMANCEAVIHLAAYTDIYKSWKEPTECFLTNVVGTQNIIRAGRSGTTLKRIVAASDLIIGHQDNWKSPYAVSKIAMENLLWDSPFSCCSLRLGTVYGDSPLPEIREGSHDFVHVDKVVDAFMKALTSNVEGMIDVGSGELTQATVMAERTGCEIRALKSSIRPVAARVYEANHLLRLELEAVA